MNFRTMVHFSIGPIGVGVIGLLIVPLMTWSFTASNIAYFSLFQLAISFLFILLGAGSEQYYVREYFEVDDKSKLLLESNVLSLFLILILCLFFIANYVVDLNINYLMQGIDVWTLLFVSSFWYLYIKSQYILRMREQGGAYSFFQLLPKLIVLFGVVLTVFLDSGEDYLKQVQYLSFIFPSILILIFMRKHWLKILGSRVGFKDIRMVVNYGFPLAVAGALFWCLSSLDRFMLMHFRTEEDVALLSVSMSFAGVGLMINMIFSTIWTPIIFKLINDYDRAKLVVPEIFEIVTAVVLVLFAMTGIFSGLVTFILPDEYGVVGFILPACMAFPLLYGVSEVSVVGLNASRKTNTVLLITFFAFLINFALNLLLISDYGVKGAVLSTVISMLFFFIARTEASSSIWLHIRSIKCYMGLIFVLIFSVFEMFLNSLGYIFFSFGWLVVLVLIVVQFKGSLKKIKLYINKEIG